MSRSGIRVSVATWIQNGAIPNLVAVFAAMPKTISMDGGSMGPDRAVGWLEVPSQVEQRRAMGPVVGGIPTGSKEVTYALTLHLRGRSVQPDPIDAALTFDSILDAILARLRQDPTTVDPALFRVADGQIDVSGVEQRLTGNATESDAAIRFQGAEWVAG